MSREIFLILMPLEFLAALVGAAMVFPDIGAVIYLIAAALFVAVLYPFYRRLKKEEDEAKKRKIRRTMSLLLLIPLLGGAIAFLSVAIILLMAFG